MNTIKRLVVLLAVAPCAFGMQADSQQATGSVEPKKFETAAVVLPALISTVPAQVESVVAPALPQPVVVAMPKLSIFNAMHNLSRKTYEQHPLLVGMGLGASLPFLKRALTVVLRNTNRYVLVAVGSSALTGLAAWVHYTEPLNQHIKQFAKDQGAKIRQSWKLSVVPQAALFTQRVAQVANKQCENVRSVWAAFKKSPSRVDGETLVNGLRQASASF